MLNAAAHKPFYIYLLVKINNFCPQCQFFLWYRTQSHGILLKLETPLLPTQPSFGSELHTCDIFRTVSCADIINTWRNTEKYSVHTFTHTHELKTRLVNI